MAKGRAARRSALRDSFEQQPFEYSEIVREERLVRFELFGVARINRWRVDADQFHALPGQILNRLRLERIEIIAPLIRIKRAGRK